MNQGRKEDHSVTLYMKIKFCYICCNIKQKKKLNSLKYLQIYFRANRSINININKQVADNTSKKHSNFH